MTVRIVAALAPRPRARTNTRDTLGAHSVALTDYSVGETDVDHDDTETIITKRNGAGDGYTSTGKIKRYRALPDSPHQSICNQVSQVTHFTVWGV